MKKADLSKMELGNLMFGNSRGEYAVEPREEYQNAFCEFLGSNGFDFYGFPTDVPASSNWQKDTRNFENATIVIRPYYWGEDENITELPNFEYKPTGLKISWYKYPMRDAYSNQDVSVGEFREILVECAKSMKEG